ncbi:hypothetical protein VQ643_06060 [Pseudomonas sp. F1_0610]|uniref:hypothetical protein n=1 Tax=Pseudomonas sp. F1_0610 TaxID=3114284 RepID=UPI0039C00AD4
MKKIYSACLIMFALLFSSHSYAGIPVFFGESDELYPIEEVAPIKVGRDEYQLGFRVYTKWFIFGLYAQDKGYILIDKHNKNTYIFLDAGLVKDLQADDLLPQTLPSYSVPTLEYLKGFSLWIALLVLGFFVLKGIFSKKEEEEVAA